ncbi:PAS/PAC sensor signal transduction histidine kinase [Desulfosarcina cetonica]|uniref:two-component system sensor histidine kinase NtrB n=1 Tax=Desulfosarcina cetonica TaxID=90730 RepID=UPI0006D27B38|nr:PAS domain-containing sensor histidine kinase [Desulfosarcina cetonica]VTR70209.1 PAS/PAC sensor signal transduction histidine kinase [Desulfosarcina cetonica]
MSITAFPIWFIDVVGSVLMIFFSFISVAYCLRLKKRDPTNIIINYLLWVCVALAVFAISRSAGHLLKQILFMTEHREWWMTIKPFSGAVNTFTFIVVASVTLFFERTWAIYGTILKDRQALQTAHEKLIYLNQNLEQLVEQRTEALAISEQKYRRIFEVSKDMILVTRTDGRIVNINPAGKQLVGLHAINDAVTERRCFQDYLSHSEDWAAITQHIENRGFISSEEFDIRLGDGAKRRVLLSGSLAKSPSEDGETIHFLIKDIEQRRQMQKQMAHADKLASIGELSSGIAHEINNPLGIILGYTQLLLRNEDPQSDRFNDLKTIEKHVRSCKAIVEDLLNFARTSSPHKERLDVHAVISDVIHFVRHHSDLKAIQIETAFTPAPPRVLMDEKKIKQVLINLLMNAIHAVEGSGTIKITTAFNPADSRISIEVADTGHGIAKENLNRIFDPFFTTKPTGEGTGLGLSVSYGIIKGHGGSITVKSDPGQGAAFTIRLPVPPPL